MNTDYEIATDEFAISPYGVHLLKEEPQEIIPFDQIHTMMIEGVFAQRNWLAYLIKGILSSAGLMVFIVLLLQGIEFSLSMLELGLIAIVGPLTISYALRTNSFVKFVYRTGTMKRFSLRKLNRMDIKRFKSMMMERLKPNVFIK